MCGELLNHTGGGWKYDGRKRPDNCPLVEVEDMNRKERIDDLNYIKKALTERTLTRYDAIVFLIDTLIEYLEDDELKGVESGETV